MNFLYEIIICIIFSAVMVPVQRKIYSSFKSRVVAYLCTLAVGIALLLILLALLRLLGLKTI